MCNFTTKRQFLAEKVVKKQFGSSGKIKGVGLFIDSTPPVIFIAMPDIQLPLLLLSAFFQK